MVWRSALVLFGVLAVLFTVSSVSAFEKYDDAALEWELETPLPSEVERGERFTVTVRFTNEGTVNLTDGNMTTIELFSRSEVYDTNQLERARGESQEVTYDVRIPRSGVYEIRITAFYRFGIVNLYNKSGSQASLLGEAHIIDSSSGIGQWLSGSTPLSYLLVISVIASIATVAFWTSRHLSEQHHSKNADKTGVGPRKA